jgi:FlaA1/EpsC-like NDP-sugar epimerase
LLFGDRLLGLSLVGLLIVGLAGLRHLIRVEVVHTGNVIHLAIKMPGRNRLLTGLLYAHDLLMLCLAVAIAVLLETGFRLRSDGLQKYLPFAVLFVTLGSLALIAARIHQRMWVRATVRDVLSLQFWLMAAAMASAGLYLVWSHEMGWGAIRLSLMSYVICILGISMPRVSLELTRELALEARHRVAEHSAEPSDYGAVAVFGAGDLGTLFLEHLKSSGPDQYKGMRLLGFLDDSEHLHGRRLRSFRILGGLSMIPHLVEQENLRGLIVAIKNPPAELLGRIERLRRKHGLTVYHWMASLDPITSAEDDLREEIHGGSGMQSNPPGRQPVAGAGGAGGPVVSGDDGRLS